jgi:Flp pilus assembly protein TadD
MEAAKQFDEYIKHRPLDWDVHFSRAVAYANSREGLVTNTATLRSYNEAIALAPPDIDGNLRARLFSYRGGILKRLRRLEEAEADLMIAQKYATDDYETNDIKYNLAGVYALKGDRRKLLETVNQLRSAPQCLVAIHAHLNDYFANFANDKEFLQAIGM